MSPFSTMGRYLARTAFVNLLVILCLLLGLIYLFDTVELIRRTGRSSDLGLDIVLTMGLMKMPEAGQVILPFAVLFGAMFTFWQLNRRSELVVLRAAGFSVWQFLAPILLMAVGTALIYIMLLNPLSAAMLARFERMENEYILHKNSAVTLLREGLWLKQNEQDGQIILNADRIDLAEFHLHDVMVLFFDENDRFVRRLDADKARLEQGKWHFIDVIDNRPGQSAQQAALISLKTDLTIQEIEETFSSPETVSFWRLPGYIRVMESTGFDATRLKIHFHALLAQPLMFASMILLAACVSLRPPRRRGTLWMVTLGLAAGFVLFFGASFMQALGASQQIPVAASAWSVAAAAFLFSIGVILNLEDG